MLEEGRSEDFVKHFCGTDFFNPPRYLKLLEIIPTTKTGPSVVSFLMDYGDKFLGKETVLCKDTPAFIANRVGVYAMEKIIQLTVDLGLTIEEADKLTVQLVDLKRCSKLSDLVGIDTGTKVAQGIKDNCPDDEQAKNFKPHKFIEFLHENKWFGNKTKKGIIQKKLEQTENQL